jgi:hypothetical protein
MSQALFANKAAKGFGPIATPLDSLVDGLTKNVRDVGAAFVEPGISRNAMSLESIDASAQQEIASSVKSLGMALESVFTDQCVGHDAQGKALGLSNAQKASAIAAAVISGDVKSWLATPVKHNVTSTESMKFLTPQGGDFMDGRMKEALEAYDEKENKNVVVYSVAYNMQAARQDEFGEAFFPTVVVTPDQFGFAVSIRLIQVMNEVRRGTTGALDNFARKNIIQAVIDPTILKNDSTKVVPVVRAGAESHFTGTGVVAPRNVYLDGESITTAPLKPGVSTSLIGISQTDALLETGMMDSTDALDSAVALEALYIQIQHATPASVKTVKVNTLRLPTAVFTNTAQGNYRAMSLMFNTESIKLDAATRSVDNVAVPGLALVTSANLTVRLAVQMSGQVNLETSAINLFASAVTVVSVTDSNGIQLDLASGDAAAVVTALAGAVVVGYDVDARRTNTNRRQRGQLLDTTFYNQVYAVPLRSPMTVPRPLTAGDQNDSSDLAALITATHIRTSNAAVEELLRVEDILAEFTSAADQSNDSPEILGVARFLVKPFFEKATINMVTAIDSVKSHERAADIQAVLVNKLRDMVYRMYRDSNYKAAADALAGGVAQIPTVIVGTDPVLARYLQISGDLRLLGNDFNVKVVSTLNRRMRGKIVATFGEFGSNDGVPNPMHFGNMAWKPELTLVLPLHRNGANSKELTVQPSFLHVTNLPIMSSITVTGIADVVASKVPVNMHTV